jgi:energy-coupling factor transporter ATP-binding protein EcfA2
MWIERVVARAFGPFQNAVLEFRPGLTVVYGPNEAGKSTWLAATRLALTGVRRGRGSTTREATEIERRHRPWDHPDSWQVEARLHLHDGRIIDISQDLAGKVACRAVDIALGEDVSAEITPTDGTPDAAIWLGIDRDAFAVTLSVSQAQILAVAQDPAGLQEHMQRAAASAASDATAALAIERLVAFRRDAVGADTSAAKGPLRTAMRAVEDTARNLEDARRRHAAYLERQARAEEAAEREGRAEIVLAAVTLGDARRRAEVLATRAARAADLQVRYPTPPAALAGGEEQAAAVAGALSAWRQRPTTDSAPTGRMPADIEAELAAPGPTVDLGPAEAERDEARSALANVALPSSAPSTPCRPRALLGLAGGVGLVVAALAAFAGLPWPAAVLAIGSLVAIGLALATRTSVRSAATASVDTERRMRAEERLAIAEANLRLVQATQGAERDRRSALERELEAARSASATAARSQASIAAADELLRAAAESAGLDRTADPSDLVVALEAWQVARVAALAEGERAIAEYQELIGLLDGGQLVDLETAAASAAEEVDRLSAAGGSALSSVPTVSEADARAALDAARHEAATLAGEAGVIEESLPSVAEAEEAAAAAHERLERVHDLASVIDETLDLLRGAQRRVHLDLAPILKRTIDAWLPAVTGGAYLEAGINPADLSIDVKEATSGQWRDAQYLSEGTREQIYLLLRVAMASHLVTTDEVAPLLLDEVTAQADTDRRLRLLSMIQTLSADRQIVLFSHDTAVRDWARSSLDPERDVLVELDPVAATVAVS